MLKANSPHNQALTYIQTGQANYSIDFQLGSHICLRQYKIQTDQYSTIFTIQFDHWSKIINPSKGLI
jgi:hypothetical protein